MPKRKNTVADQLSVIIPYRELEKLLNATNQIEEIEKRYKRIEERLAATQYLYLEILEKVNEIDRYL